MRISHDGILYALFLGAMLFLAGPAPAQGNLECVPFARQASGIQLFGNAAGWWDQASGRYDRGHVPRIGSVLVFRPSGAMSAGHVAMVSGIVSDREIRVTHANWSVIDGRRGQIERDVTAVDVSAAGDWSAVRVWYAPIGKIGTQAYPTYGFVYAGKAAPDRPLELASLQRPRRASRPSHLAGLEAVIDRALASADDSPASTIKLAIDTRSLLF